MEWAAFQHSCASVEPSLSPLLALHLMRLRVDQASSRLGRVSDCLLYLAWTRFCPELLALP